MRRGEKVGRGPIHLRAASVRVPLSAVILGWLGRFLGRALMRILAQPVLWAALAVYGTGYWLAVTVGPWPLLITALTVTVALVGWRQAHRPSFQRWLSWPVRSTWRRTLVYRRYWQPAMVTTGLAVRLNGREYLPKLVKVASTSSVDRVTVRMLPGQVAEDYAEVVERLAQTFDAADCRVRTDPQHRDRLILWFLVHDPLTEPVAPLDSEDASDLGGLPVARARTACLPARPARLARPAGRPRPVRESPGRSGRSSTPWPRASAAGWCSCGCATPRAAWNWPAGSGCSPGSATARPPTTPSGRA